MATEEKIPCEPYCRTAHRGRNASGAKTQSSRIESVLVDEPTEDWVSGDRVLALCGPSWSIPLLIGDRNPSA